MAFEDDMIDAGYSNEEEYLESLIDEFEEDYERRLEREAQYNDDTYDDDEEEDYERYEKLRKQEKWVKDWETNNPELSIIWQRYFSSISHNADIAFMDCRHFMGLNEYIELKKWLYERERFEKERQKEDWKENLKVLFSKYKNELFDFYFPEDESLIDNSLITQQAHELFSIEKSEPSLWEKVCSSYTIDPKLFEKMEEYVFWNEGYKREMDYEYWKDNSIYQYIDQYNKIIKQWIADSSFYIFGEWMSKHEKEKIEWTHENQELWNKYKKNYEIREKNKYIESKILEYKSEYKNSGKIQSQFSYMEFEDDDLFDDYSIKKSNPFLPDLESAIEKPYDINSLDLELRQYIKECIGSLDMSKLSEESTIHADKCLTQLWIYQNRDEWEKGEVKKRFDYLFRCEKYSQELLTWWKSKYPNKWIEFKKTTVSKFKKNFEIFMKFRLWALNGNKEEFILLAEKYLIYWKETIKLIYNKDLYDQLCHYCYDKSSFSFDYSNKDIVYYIKKYFQTNKVDEIWLKELQDKVIWEIVYKDNYQEHYNIRSMYTSLL